MVNSDLGNNLINVVVVVSIIIAFSGLVISGLNDIGGVVIIGLLFSSVLILIFSIVCFIRIRNTIMGKN